jgi:hypothetical protein
MLPSRTVEQTFKVNVTDDGLLTSFNYSAQDRSAEIAGNLLRGVAGVAGTFLGVSNFGSAIDLNPAADEEDRRKLYLPLAEHCFVNSPDERADTLGKELLNLLISLENAKRDHQNVLAQVTRASAAADVQRLRAQDSLLTRREAILSERIAGTRAALAVEASAYAVRQGIGVGEDTVRMQEVFDLTELPATVGDGTLATEISGMTAASEQMTNFFRQSRLIVTLRERTSPAGDPVVHDPQTGTASLACKQNDAETCARIRYRQPVPREIRVYSPSGPKADAPLRLQEVRTVPLISSADPVLNMAVDAKALGTGKATIAFGRYSNITSLEQASDARLARATSTLADALSGARQEFLSGLQAAQTTQSTLINMRANSRTERIKELTDQKTLIDAQVALEGANANRRLLEQKASVDAQLALLKSQQDLEAAQRSAATATDVADLRDEIQRLQVELDLVRKQLELEKVQRELEGLRNPD